jgi:hypothetical protein
MMYKGQSRWLSSVYFPEKNECVKKQNRFSLFVCSLVLYKYIKSLRIDVYNLYNNRHERIKRYGEFYHGILYIGHHIRINISHTYRDK